MEMSTQKNRKRKAEKPILAVQHKRRRPKQMRLSDECTSNLLNEHSPFLKCASGNACVAELVPYLADSPSSVHAFSLTSKLTFGMTILCMKEVCRIRWLAKIEFERRWGEANQEAEEVGDWTFWYSRYFYEEMMGREERIKEDVLWRLSWRMEDGPNSGSIRFMPLPNPRPRGFPRIIQPQNVGLGIVEGKKFLSARVRDRFWYVVKKKADHGKEGGSRVWTGIPIAERRRENMFVVKRTDSWGYILAAETSRIVSVP